MSDPKWTGLMVIVGLLGCSDPKAGDTTSDSGSASDEVGVDESTTESEGGSTSETSTTETSTESTTDTTDTTETTETSTDTTTETSTDTTTDTTTETSTDTGTSDSGILGCADVCGTPECGECPASVVLIDAGDFMIEATEVPVANYALFMAVEFSPELLHPDCGWKNGFEPDNWAEKLAGPPDMPVTEVDWCDAEAYCRWSGGHMCGLIGGGPTLLDDVANPNGEWYDACSNSGAVTFAYGQTYMPMACNGLDFGLGTFQAVGALASCQGGLAGLYDMSGNVREWANGCGVDPQVTDPAQLCQRRGGGFNSGVGALDCEGNSQRERNDRSSTTGIRCCTDG